MCLYVGKTHVEIEMVVYNNSSVFMSCQVPVSSYYDSWPEHLELEISRSVEN